MRRAVALVALVAALTAVGIGSATTARPTLQLVSTYPLIVRGTGFVPFERVKVTLVGETRRVRYASASAAGRFGARFAVGVDVCSPYRVEALGDRGSRAVLVPRPLAACAPAGPAS